MSLFIRSLSWCYWLSNWKDFGRLLTCEQQTKSGQICILIYSKTWLAETELGCRAKHSPDQDDTSCVKWSQLSHSILNLFDNDSSVYNFYQTRSNK